jgi:hypothetical protein
MKLLSKYLLGALVWRDIWQDKNTTIDNDTNKRIPHKFRALPFQWAVINKVCLASIVEQSNVL